MTTAPPASTSRQSSTGGGGRLAVEPAAERLGEGLERRPQRLVRARACRTAFPARASTRSCATTSSTLPSTPPPKVPMIAAPAGSGSWSGDGSGLGLAGRQRVGGRDLRERLRDRRQHAARQRSPRRRRWAWSGTRGEAENDMRGAPSGGTGRAAGRAQFGRRRSGRRGACRTIPGTARANVVFAEVTDSGCEVLWPRVRTSPTVSRPIVGRRQAQRSRSGPRPRCRRPRAAAWSAPTAWRRSVARSRWSSLSDEHVERRREHRVGEAEVGGAACGCPTVSSMRAAITGSVAAAAWMNWTFVSRPRICGRGRR